MSEFLRIEKPIQAAFKSDSIYFSPEARADGIYKGHPYPFCIPKQFAEENLYPGIRQSITQYFDHNKIKWHDGYEGKPSNHMCDSQVCCANFLFPFADQPKALSELLRPIFPSLQEMLLIEDDLYVAFEWIGEKNYLREISRNGLRSRGANYTSADAAVMFQSANGSKQIVLIEWKYTESYYPTWLKNATSGRDRTTIYAHLYDADDCPLNKDLIPNFDALFYEPFYQFMRQQFLAHEMEKAHELGANRVSLLHISPANNRDFMRITSPDLRALDISATGVWGRLVRTPGSFTAVYTENLFGHFPVEKFLAMMDWWNYITTRYRWVIG